MKKTLCITFLLIVLSMFWTQSFASENWRQGTIVSIEGSNITINKTTYKIASDIIVEDNTGNALSVEVLGNPCCRKIKFLASGDYVKKIVIITTEDRW